MIKLNTFNDTVAKCARQLKTMPLCSYLYEMGKLFNSFYTECPIAKASTEELRQARLQLAQATGKVMRQGLELLGIPAPKRM